MFGGEVFLNMFGGDVYGVLILIVITNFPGNCFLLVVVVVRRKKLSS